MKQNLLENIDIIGQRIKDITEAIIKKNYFDQQSSHTQNCENSAPYESLSLKNREIFEIAVNTPKGVKSVGYE